MQIIGGKYKKKKLHSPKNEEIRPTSSRLRETVFNLCQGEIEGAKFLDLFAGSGAIGLEALSRGANHVIFIEKSRGASKIIKDNITALKEEKTTLVIVADALHTLEKFAQNGDKFDLIFADPPYGLGLGKEVAKLIDRGDLLKEGGKLYIEDEASMPDLEPNFTHLKLHDSRKIGRAWLKTYLRKS